MSRKATEIDASDDGEVIMLLNDLTPEYGILSMPRSRQSHGLSGINGQTHAHCDPAWEVIDLTDDGRSKKNKSKKDASITLLQPNSLSRKR